MNILESSNSQLSLKPLGAGDLIDRSFRFYRKFFWTFILIASPPVIVGTILLVGWTAFARLIFQVNSIDPAEQIFYNLFSFFGNFVIWLIQIIAMMTVMGGASRNFVRHILFDEKITFRETYKSVKKRFFGLVGISAFIVFITILLTLVALPIITTIWSIFFGAVGYIFVDFPSVIGISIFVSTIVVILAMIFVVFLILSRFVYTPQIMLVEGQGAFSAFGRSITLAGKNIRRVAALSIFTILATYSAMALFYVLLGWAAFVNGINLTDMFYADTVPAWYEISTEVVGQISFILLTPIWLIGLCLLYVDERVRNEGYDIEMMAAKHLGGIPSVPDKFVNPLQPALAKQDSAGQIQNQTVSKKSSGSMLGLE